MFKGIKFLKLTTMALGVLAVWDFYFVHADTPRIIHLSAKTFEFSLNSIDVRQGETVIFEIESEDRVHGFSVPELGVRQSIRPGQITRIKLSFNQAGQLEFLCYIFCGDGHEHMTGVINVKAG